MSGIPVFPHQTKEINVTSIAYASCVSLARSPTPPQLITTILTRVSRSHACLNIFVAFVCVPKEEYRLHVSAFLYKWYDVVCFHIQHFSFCKRFYRHHTIFPYKMYDSRAFGLFRELCVHHHHQFQNTCYSRENTATHFGHHPRSPHPPRPLATGNLSVPIS